MCSRRVLKQPWVVGWRMFFFWVSVVSVTKGRCASNIPSLCGKRCGSSICFSPWLQEGWWMGDSTTFPDWILYLQFCWRLQTISNLSSSWWTTTLFAWFLPTFERLYLTCGGFKTNLAFRRPNSWFRSNGTRELGTRRGQCFHVATWCCFHFGLRCSTFGRKRSSHIGAEYDLRWFICWYCSLEPFKLVDQHTFLITGQCPCFGAKTLRLRW